MNNNYNNYDNGYTQPYNNNQQYPMYNVPNNNGKSFAIASLVLSIVSLFCCGPIASILGLIFGVISKNKKPQQNGMATAGIIISIISFVLWIICVIILTASGEIFDPVNSAAF